MFQTLPRTSDKTAALNGRRQLADNTRQKFLRFLASIFRPSNLPIHLRLDEHSGKDR